MTDLRASLQHGLCERSNEFLHLHSHETEPRSLPLQALTTDVRSVGLRTHCPPLLKGKPSLLRLPFIICHHSLINERLLTEVFEFFRK